MATKGGSKAEARRRKIIERGSERFDFIKATIQDLSITPPPPISQSQTEDIDDQQSPLPSALPFTDYSWSSKMTESFNGSFDFGSQTDDSTTSGGPRLEPIYDGFLCPLTKQVMRDPVTLETGITFEREAITKWFRECRESGRKPICPLTLKELKSTHLNPSIALRNTIEEWTARNEAAQLDMARRSLSLASSESDIMQFLKYVCLICQKSRSNKHVIRSADVIPLIVEMLKSSSREVRRKALETLQVVVEEDDDNKEIIAQGDTVRTVVKFLSNEQTKEKEEAVSLLYELSKSESLCEKIGSIHGAILLLVGMATSKSENVLTVDKADKTLENLEKSENNVRQMAENNRLKPLLTKLLQGSTDTKLSMASYLGELALSNEVKVDVAKTVGSTLIDIMRSRDMQSREAALKALNQISSSEASAKVLVDEGILEPLVKDLFTVGVNQLPTRLKEVSATILSNLVNSGYDFENIPVGPNHQTLVSEEIVHNLLHLISNTGPAIECKLIQVLVGLTSSSSTIGNVVAAIKSSGATKSIVQFIETPQKDLQLASIKLLQNLSTHMGQEMADTLRGTVGQLDSLIKIISENSGITEEQAAAACFLAELPERDLGLTQQMLSGGAFQLIISRLVQIRQRGTRGTRFVTCFQEGLVKVLARVTYALANESDAITLCQEHNVAAIFIELLQANGLDNLQIVSAAALENLSLQSKILTRLPEVARPGCFASIFACTSKAQVITGLCPLHRGICSLKETFCLLEGRAVDKLVVLLDHANEKVAEAALAAICSLLDDDVNIDHCVILLSEAEGVKLILDILLENRTENLRRRAVWAVEKILRSDNVAIDIAGDPKVCSALVDAFQHSDFITRQVAERALKHINRLPIFSSIYPSAG